MKRQSNNIPTLYQYSVCPFCDKVKTILCYKKIPFLPIEVNPMNKKEIAFSKNYKKVPILVDQYGVQVNDSTPIMRHIDDQYPEPKVFATKPNEVEEESKWLNWSDEKLVKALPPLIYDTLGHSLQAFDYITKKGSFSWWRRLYIKYSGAFVMWMVGKKLAKKYEILDPSQHLAHLLNNFANGLHQRDFLGGENPNGADLAIYGMLHSISELPGFEIVKNQPLIYEWYTRVTKKL